MSDVLCPLCGGTTRPVWQESSFAIHNCTSCTLQFKHIPGLSRAITEEFQSTLYNDSASRSRVKRYNRMMRDRVDIMTRFKSHGQLLEIGCATGGFLTEAKMRGFNVTGVDASQNYAEYTSQLGLDVRHGRLEDLELPLASFDVIAFSHLLEHIEDPEAFLERIKTYLKPDGIVFMVVPNADSFTNRTLGYRHPVYQEADHLFFFSGKTLGQFLDKAGFRVVYLSTREYTHHIFTSLKNMLSGNHKHDATGPDKPSTRGRRWAKLPYLLGVILYPFTRTYGRILEACHRGHELIAVAKLSTEPNPNRTGNPDEPCES